MSLLPKHVGRDAFHMPSASHIILSDPESLCPHIQVKAAFPPKVLLCSST